MKNEMMALGALVVMAASVASAGEEPTGKTLKRLFAAGGGKILFIGNSITLHGPKPDIGWTNNFGMAASAADNDYVHLVQKSVAELVGKTSTAMVVNGADFERQYTTVDVKSKFAPCFAFKADLAIVALGENVPTPGNEETKATFKRQFVLLLSELKKSGNPEVFVRSSFWADATKDDIMKSACAETGCTFVDIHTLGANEANYARSERKFEHSGVAAHPGDKGMKAIADALLEAIRKN